MDVAARPPRPGERRPRSGARSAFWSRTSSSPRASSSSSPGSSRRPLPSGRARTVLGSMRLIVARCEVRYSGRLKAVLPEALRLLMLKADGSVMVHADTGGFKPQNSG